MPRKASFIALSHLLLGGVFEPGPAPAAEYRDERDPGPFPGPRSPYSGRGRGGQGKLCTNTPGQRLSSSAVQQLRLISDCLQDSDSFETSHTLI